MRQKRQHFQKQIRRQALEKIFKNKRRQYFNYTFKDQPSNQTTNQIKDQCHTEFARYIHEIEEALMKQEEMQVCTSVKQSALLLKRILNKAKNSAACITLIVQHWYDLGFDLQLYNSVALFIHFSKQQFSGIRKQTYKYALEHFSLIYEYESLIKKRDNDYEDRMFRFLFMVLIELQNEPESIIDIMHVIQSIIFASTKMRHSFFFSNKFDNSNADTIGKICFEHLITTMYQNEEKMNQHNSESQEKRYNHLRMLFIQFINMYFVELKDMEKYISDCKKIGANENVPQALKIKNDDYEYTLSLFDFPRQITLKKFLQSYQISVMHDTICKMKTLCFSRHSKEDQQQQNLATCLSAFRGMIEFHSSRKVMKGFENQLQFMIAKLITKQYTITVKTEIITLLDTIIFIDTDNVMTDHLVRNHNLFQILWSYKDKSVLKVKLNIVNNLLLSTAGFQVIGRYLSEICVVLFGTKQVGLAQTFCLNYLIQSNYSLTPTSRFEIIIEILYSLQKQYFGVEQLERDFYIFSHLYQKGFCKILPQRYQQWKNCSNLVNYKLTQAVDMNKHQEEQKIMHIERVIQLEQESLGKIHIQE